MTTPSEITATEKLLDLIRASSISERKDAVDLPGTSASGTGLTSQELFLKDDRAPVATQVTADKGGEFILTLETPDTDTPSPVSPPTMTAERSIFDDTFTEQDPDTPLELIRSSSVAEKNHGDQQELDQAITSLQAEKKTDLTLTLDGPDQQDDFKRPLVSEPFPPPQSEPSSPLDKIDDFSLADEISPPTPSPEGAEPSANTPPLDDDDGFLGDRLAATDSNNPIPLNHITIPSITPILAASTFSLQRFFSVKRLRSSTKTTIGIDIRPGIIHIVKTKTNKNSTDLLAYDSVPYDFDPAAEPKNLCEDHGFMAILFRTVARFHTGQDHHEIWCSYPFTSPIELHNITIPKVAEKDLAKAVFWSAKQQLEFDEAVTIFDFFILQDVIEAEQAKIQALVALAPSAEVDDVKTMFKNAGFPLTGISFPAAAIQNYLHHDPTIPTDQPIVYFTIRKSYSFIDLFYQGKTFFSRVIKTGVDSFIESLLDQALNQRIVIDEETAKEYLFRSEDRGPILHQDSTSIASLLDWAQLSVIDRLARQLVRTFEYCATTFKVPAIGAIVTSGEYTVNDAILKAIENRVGIKCSFIEPLSSTIFHRNSALTPPKISNLLIAAGLSLSDRQSTANFLFTFAHRAKDASSDRVNNLIAMGSLFLAIGLGVTFIWLYNKELDKKQEVARLRDQLEDNFTSEPRTRDNQYLTQTVNKITQFHLDNKEKSKRFKTVAMVAELTKTLGNDITLTDLILDQQPAMEILGNPPETSSPDGSLTIMGFISAPPGNQEFLLMNLLKDLAQLKTLGEPILQSRSNASLHNQDVLRFEVRLKATLNSLSPPPPAT